MEIVSATDFARYSHRQLYDMLHAGQPKTMRAAADSWDAVGSRLHEQAGNLEQQLSRFRHQWRGGAAEQYQAMITDLAAGLRRTAEAAHAMRNLAHDSAEALIRAQATMPPPTEVPEVSAATLRLAGTPIQLGPGTSPELAARVATQQAEAVAAVRQQQQAAQVANASHARAVLIMEDLANRYRVAQASIPDSPAGQVPSGTPGADHPGSGATQSRPPLFGGMFTAGLAAASAAAAGRFAGTLPKIPDWARKPDPQTGLPAPGAGAEAAKLGAGAAAGGAGLAAGLGKLGGGGGGGLGKVAGAGGQGPQAAAGLAGAVGAAAAARGIAGAMGAAAGAAQGMAGGMPMMPMMPMGGGQGGDMGGGRRIPPWLVETEDVWGESSVITPQVIGEEPENRPEPPSSFRY
ncbi:WXG100 family type VII secretion target [Crossiella sp. CA198]|uniref:WXG100 family type VII secretion target n=1 Tax=Crossiella sp. CA198 TaxID=3455607 RepID=UPI003F8D09FF